MNLIGTANIYTNWKKLLISSADLAQDVFSVMLVGPNYNFDLNKHETLADVGDEAQGSGYARQTLGGVELIKIGKGITMSANDVSFTAQGGSFSADKYIIYDESVLVPFKPLVTVGFLGEDKAIVKVTDGNSLTISFRPNGVLLIE